MKYRYIDTSEIMINVHIPTGHLNQLIEWMADYRLSLEDGSLDKLIMGDRIKEMQTIYEEAMTYIANYAEGQKTNV